MKVFPSLESIVSPFQGILLDAYGVFWGGNKIGPLPGSVKVMERLVSSGKIVGILSNSSQLAEREIEKLKLHGLHMGQHFHFFLTSGEVAKGIFKEEKLPFAAPKKSFYVFGSDHPMLFEESLFEETKELSKADFIYLGVPHVKGEDQTDPKVFWQEVEKLKEIGIPIVCANPDRFAHEGNPPKAVVRQGSLASYFEEIGGEVFYIGKPASLGYLMAIELFKEKQIGLDQLLMVGDTPETDIRGARKVGMKSALVLHTGMVAEQVKELDLHSFLNKLDPRDRPDFLIERL